MAFLRALPSAVPFVFACLAFIFSLLTITSRDWASRAQYADTTDILTQFEPIYTIYRSPFQICNANATVVGDDTIPTNNTDADGNELPPPPLNYTYSLYCDRYRAFGFNRTSCELATATNSNVVPEIGDRRWCQQIHYAGNYSIASTVFIGTTFILVLLMTVVAVLSGANDNDFADGGSTREGLADDEAEAEAEAAADTSLGSAKAESIPDGKPHHNHHHRHRHRQRIRQPRSTKSVITAGVNLLIVTFSFIGVATALISQFYGVLAFVQSAPNNAEFATSQGNREHHDPWVQGKALSVYMTLSWSFGIAAGFSALAVWRFPTADKII